jgi:hypothetical protein
LYRLARYCGFADYECQLFGGQYHWEFLGGNYYFNCAWEHTPQTELGFASVDVIEREKIL